MVKSQLDSKQTVKLLQLRGRISVDQIASQFNVSRATVYRKFKVYDSEERWTRKKTTRRLAIDSPTQNRLQNYVKVNPFHTLFELKCNLELNTSISSISRLLKSKGLPSYVSPKKFLIKPLQAGVRVDVASVRKDWTISKWKTIVFTDESGLDNSGYMKRYVRRPRGEKYNERYIDKHVNANRRLNFFSWVTRDGTGDIYFYTRMDSTLYCECVSTMIDTLREHYGDNFLVVHDNARFSTSRETLDYLIRHDLNRYFLAIPAYSPDMNIIENLWALLKRRVRQYIFDFGPQRELDEFRNLITETWCNIEQDIIDNLYDSLPNRMHKIIAAEGQLSRY